MRRFLKQLLYGLFYLAFWALVALGVYFIYFRPTPTCTDGVKNQGEEDFDCGGPCDECFLRDIKPLRVVQPQLFEAGEGATTVLVEVRNSNLGYAAPVFGYDLNFYDEQGQIIFSSSDELFIYAGEIKTIVFPALEANFGDIFKTEFLPKDVAWVSGDKFPKPDLEYREIRTFREGAGFAVSGVTMNKSSYAVKQAVISAALINRNGLLVNASKTAASNLAPSEERFFKIFVPVLAVESENIDLFQTRIFIDAKR